MTTERLLTRLIKHRFDVATCFHNLYLMRNTSICIKSSKNNPKIWFLNEIQKLLICHSSRRFDSANHSLTKWVTRCYLWKHISKYSPKNSALESTLIFCPTLPKQLLRDIKADDVVWLPALCRAARRRGGQLTKRSSERPAAFPQKFFACYSTTSEANFIKLCIPSLSYVSYHLDVKH